MRSACQEIASDHSCTCFCFTVSFLRATRRYFNSCSLRPKLFQRLDLDRCHLWCFHEEPAMPCQPSRTLCGSKGFFFGASTCVQPNGGNGWRSLLFCQPQSLVALMDMHVQISLIDTHAQFVTAVSMRARCHSYLPLSLISNCASWLSAFFLAAFCFLLSSTILIN